MNDTQGDYTVYFHPCTNVQIMTKSGEKCANGNNVSVRFKIQSCNDLNLTVYMSLVVSICRNYYARVL